MVALCQAPFLLDDPNVGLVFPADAIARAKHYLSLTSGGLGNLFDFFYAILLWKRINYTQLLRSYNFLVFYMCSSLSLSLSLTLSCDFLFWTVGTFNQLNNSALFHIFRSPYHVNLLERIT